MPYLAFQPIAFVTEISVTHSKTIHFIGLFGDLGGTEKATLEEMLMLRNAGYNVEYTCITKMSRFQASLEKHNLPWKSCNYRGCWDLKAFLCLWRRIKDVKSIRIILVGMNLISMLCILIQGHHKTTYLRHHYHHFGGQTLPYYKWWINYAVASLAVKSIAYVCNYIRDEAIQIWPSINQRSCVIYNIFQTQPEVTASEQLAARNHFNVPSDAFVIGGAGRFGLVKRWDIWTEVLAQVMKANENAVALVVGGGSQEHYIQELMKRHQNQVIFLGTISDMENFYKAIDVLLFVSDFDATPRVPMEAISWGKPVVAALTKGGLGEIYPKHILPFFSQIDENTLVTALLHNNDLFENWKDELDISIFSSESIRPFYLSWLNL